MLNRIIAELEKSAQGKALEASMEKGAPSWLNALTLKRRGYNIESSAEKRDLNLSEAICFIRTKLSFSLARSMVLCIRGSRSVRNTAASVADTDIRLANSEACLKPDEN